MRMLIALSIACWTFVCLAGPPTNYSDDTEPNFEPTIVRARNAAGTNGTVTVAIEDVGTAPNTIAMNAYVVNDGTTTYKGYLPTAPGKPWSFDPYLYPSQHATGPAPYRLYCVGIMSAGPFTDNSITVWRSDDFGRDGFAPLPYRIIETGGPMIDLPDGVNYEERTLDKPTIVVNGYGSYKGYVYVSYTRKSTIKRKSDGAFVKSFWSIYVSRSTDGGNTWATPVPIWTNEGPVNTAATPATTSHIMAANGNGYLYVTWGIFPVTPTTKGTIMIARSASAGAITGTWVVDGTGPTGYFRNLDSNGIKTATIPVARYNWVKNKVMVVWNERDGSGTSAKSDVYYAEKGPSGWTSWDGGLTYKLKVSNESACGPTDQLRPALDFDSTGKTSIVYYDRQNDCANDRYDLYYMQLTTSATAPASVALGPTKLSTFTSDVSDNALRLGEYLDVWCESEGCYTAWIGTPNARGDVLVSTIP